MSSGFYQALNMFLFLAVELSLLFLAVSFFVGILQSYLSQSKVEKLMGGENWASYFIAALLGAVTPFCSCSTIPMLKGLRRAHAGFGPMMVFLFASPLLNPIIVVLLVVTFGPKLSLIYVSVAFIVSLLAGYLLQYFNFERYLREMSTGVQGSCSKDCSATSPAVQQSSCSPQTCTPNSSPAPDAKQSCCTPIKNSKKNRMAAIWRSTWSDFIDVLPYLFLGILIGSIIYGFVPTQLLERIAGKQNPFAIPVAAIIGIPLYVRAESVIPLAGALLAKGVGAGTVMALIIGSAGASLTELILLRALFGFRLIAVFTMVIFLMAITAGYATLLLY